MTKLLTVFGVLVVSRAITIVPSDVSKVAVYDFLASMHIGGAFVKFVVRTAVPSVAGHFVSPSICSPGVVDNVGVREAIVVSDAATVVSLEATVVSDVATVVSLELVESVVMKNFETAHRARMASGMPMPKRITRCLMTAFLCAFWRPSRARLRLTFLRSRLSVPMNSAGYRLADNLINWWE